MKVAAYQVPLWSAVSGQALRFIRHQVKACESKGVEMLCCPEAVLGGLADYVSRPTDIAIDIEAGQLQALLDPIASEVVTTIIGFTEVDRTGQLYNSAAVFHKGSVVGKCRKLHPAIHKSRYAAGDEIRVFTIGDLSFGILICRDSTYSEPARVMASQGAAALFVPTNNALPHLKASPELLAEARQADVARATENGVWVIRADVAGRTENLVSYGCSEIVNPKGEVAHAATRLRPDLVVANIEIARPTRA